VGTVHTYAGNGPANLVSNAIPFKPGVLLNSRNVRVLDGTAEVPLGTQVLATWPQDGSVRSLLVQFNAPVAKDYTIEIGGPRTTADTAILPVTWDLPQRILTLPAVYLSDSLIVWEQKPLDQSVFPAWDTKQTSLYSLIGTVGTSPCARDDQEYDAITTTYQLYARTGDLKYLVNARRWALHHRRDQIYLSGTNIGHPQCSDGNLNNSAYTFPQGLVQDYFMFGDEEARRVSGFIVDNFYMNSLWEGWWYKAPDSRGFWTEQEAAFALIGIMAHYEATNDVRYLEFARARVAGLHRMQMENGRSAWVHNLSDHDPAQGCLTTDSGSSPWMSGLLLEGLIKYHKLTGEAMARESILMAVDDLRARYVATAGPYANRSFIYLGCSYYRDGTPDLDNLIAHAFGYAYQVTGNTAYKDFGTAIFNTSVADGRTSTHRQYNQQFRSSGHFVAYVSGTDTQRSGDTTESTMGVTSPANRQLGSGKAVVPTARAEAAAMPLPASVNALTMPGGTTTKAILAGACAVSSTGGKPTTSVPVLTTTLKERWQEAWVASPAVADLDGDGVNEIIIPRGNRLVVWRPDGSIKWGVDVGTVRTWASPVVANFIGDSKLEVVVAARSQIYMFTADGRLAPGFPVTWRDEIRSIAAGDLNGDGKPEIVAVTTNALAANGQQDIILAISANGTRLPGWPPNTTGTSGCDNKCYVTGGYDQNVAIGPIDGDTRMDVFVGQDNGYMSWHQGSGVAFLASPLFPGRKTVLGLRFFLDYALVKLGWSPNPAVDLQAHMTNTAPAIADIDGNGINELVFVSSVQNAAQTNRLKGVALWAVNKDGTRPAAWQTPFHVPTYLSGLSDLGATNIVAATNQVSIADFSATIPGLDMVFAGFDGKIHLVGADRRERWSYQYTTRTDVLTGGVAIADLSGDGIPEVVFTSYSTAVGVSHLFILNSTGVLQAKVPLPGRGAMPVPTIADVNRDGTLDIVVSLKNGEDGVRSALVYRVPGSSTNCLPWPTGRGNYLRNGYFKAR
jgi:hypothetical protein